MQSLRRGGIRPSASVRSIIILGALCIGAVQAMTAYEIWRQYTHTITQAERNLNLLADVLSVEINRAIVAVDIVVEQTSLDTAINAHRPAEEIRRSLRDRALGVPALYGLMVADGNNAPFASLQPASSRFTALVESIREGHRNTDLPFHIGTITPAPIDGTPIIPFSRFREDASGTVTTVTIGAINAHYFQDLFLNVKALQGANLTLARLDGAILAQAPDGTRADVSDLAEFRPHARDNGLLHDRGEAPSRIVAFRTLRPYGLRLSVALETSELLTLWRSNALRLLLAAQAGSLALIGLVVLLLRRLALDERQLSTLRESEHSGRMAQFSLDNTSDLVVWADDQGRILYANKAAHDLLQYEADSLIGKWVDEIDPHYPRAEWRQNFNQLRKAKHLRFETSLRDRSDQMLPVEVTVALCRLNGQDYSCAILRDMIERKRTEIMLAERTQKLEASNAELEQFAYVASHDLREPLRMVNSFIGLLTRRFGDQMDAESKEFAKFARDGATRMDRLILDLLEFSRVGASGRPLVPVDLTSVLDATRADLSLSLQEAQAQLRVPSNLPTVLADPDELGRLFLNLIGNALKYRHPDRPPVIEVDIQAQVDLVTCLVRDNGIGIAPQYYDRIFRIFQRLHGRERYEGTGIGLAICKKIVEHHGGRIWVSSTPDEGSSFFFTLKPAPRT